MLTIKTNNQFRNTLYGYELTAKERAEFDYLTDEEIQDRSFVRYRGWCYDLSEFMRCNLNGSFPEWANWDGYSSDSAFSGVLVKYSADFEQVKLATYYS
jgi:hypothetical protein